MATLDTVRSTLGEGDRVALEQAEDAIEVASQWAQEKLDNYILSVERNGNDHMELKIGYIISRRTSIDAFIGKSSDCGQFGKDIINKLISPKEGHSRWEALGDSAGTIISKLMGAAAGSAQSEKLYEIMFDELGGLNRIDGYFFCYRFASSGIYDRTKAVVGSCVIRSAAIMVDDNAYRVVLANSATLTDATRAAITEQMIEVARNQKASLDDNGNVVPSDSELLAARAKLSQAIGEGVASSAEQLQRRAEIAAGQTGRKTPFKASGAGKGAEEQAGELGEKYKTLLIDETPAAAGAGLTITGANIPSQPSAPTDPPAGST